MSTQEPGSAARPRRRYKRFPRSWLDRWVEWSWGLYGTPAQKDAAREAARRLEGAADLLSPEARAKYNRICGAVYAASYCDILELMLPARDVLAELEALEAEAHEQEAPRRQIKNPPKGEGGF